MPESAIITPAVRADLASAGTLRIGINYSNFILAAKDAATGEPGGVAIDLAKDIARRLGVPVAVIAYDAVGGMCDAASRNVWDIAFLGSDPQREKIMDFTPAYLEIEATYLVPGHSRFSNAAEVDDDGVRIAAQARANFELYLSRSLKRAQLVSTQGVEEAFGLLADGRVDALAGLTQGLAELSEKLPGSVVLDGRFMAVQQSVAVPKGREAGLAYLRAVLEEAKTSGLVADAVAKLGVRGVSVAP